MATRPVRSIVALLAACASFGVAGIPIASGQDAVPCHQSVPVIADRTIVPGERIGSLRLDGKISDIVKQCGPGVVAVEGGARKAQLFSLETWNAIGLWVQFDSMTGNVVWISIEAGHPGSWTDYITVDGVRLGMKIRELVSAMGPPERILTAGGFTSFYYDRRGVRFTSTDAGPFAGRVGAIRVVWRSTPHGDTEIVPGKRISGAEVGGDAGHVIAELGGGYHEGESKPGIDVYYWPHLGLSIVEKQGYVISVRASRDRPADAADISYRTAGGLGQGSTVADVKEAFGDPVIERGPPGEWLVFPKRGVAFAIDNAGHVTMVDVFQAEVQ